jgi:hypothetical protein
MGRTNDDDQPTLAEAWAMLGERLGLTIEARRDDSIRASGQVRGRDVVVDIERKAARSEGWRVLFSVNTISSRNRRDEWHTMLSVSCANPSGMTGTIESVVDTNDPAWNPREYDPRNGRSVTTDPPALAATVLTPDIRERLMNVLGDPTIHVDAAAIRIDDHSTSKPDGGASYIAGSLIHHYQGSPPPLPERAVAGPPWWIDLLCDIADTLDR